MGKNLMIMPNQVRVLYYWGCYLWSMPNDHLLHPQDAESLAQALAHGIPLIRILCLFPIYACPHYAVRAPVELSSKTNAPKENMQVTPDYDYHPNPTDMPGYGLQGRFASCEI